jgi:hypothetical protein
VVWGTLLNGSDVVIKYLRLVFVMPFLLGSLLIDLLQCKGKDKFIFLKWNPMARAACMAVIILFVFIAVVGDVEQPFVYQVF